MKRQFVAVGLALTMVFSQGGQAFAVSASITPATQSHAHNVASHWWLGWGDTSPFNVLFDYGDGYGLYWSSTTLRSYYATYGFSPCPGDPTLYYQSLSVFDGYHYPYYNGYAVSYSSARESQGSPC